MAYKIKFILILILLFSNKTNANLCSLVFAQMPDFGAELRELSRQIQNIPINEAIPEELMGSLRQLLNLEGLSFETNEDYVKYYTETTDTLVSRTDVLTVQITVRTHSFLFFKKDQTIKLYLALVDSETPLGRSDFTQSVRGVRHGLLVNLIVKIFGKKRAEKSIYENLFLRGNFTFITPFDESEAHLYPEIMMGMEGVTMYEHKKDEDFGMDFVRVEYQRSKPRIPEDD